MKVRELKELLENFDDNMEVGFSYPARDHWRTTVVLTPLSAEKQSVVYSDYHSMLKLVDHDDSDFDKAKTMVVLEG